MSLIPRFANYPMDKEAILSGSPEELLSYIKKLILEMHKVYDSTYIAVDKIGSYVKEVKTIISAYTALGKDTVLLSNGTSGAFTIGLPSAGNLRGKIYTVMKIDSSGNAITVNPAGAETINGSATKVLSSQWDTVTIVSNGSNWYEV